MLPVAKELFKDHDFDIRQSTSYLLESFKKHVFLTFFRGSNIIHLAAVVNIEHI